MKRLLALFIICLTINLYAQKPLSLASSFYNTLNNYVLYNDHIEYQKLMTLCDAGFRVSDRFAQEQTDIPSPSLLLQNYLELLRDKQVKLAITDMREITISNHRTEGASTKTVLVNVTFSSPKTSTYKLQNVVYIRNNKIFCVGDYEVDNRQIVSNNYKDTIIYYNDNSTFRLYGTTKRHTDNAIGLTYLREQINEKRQCRTGAITANDIGVVVFGKNGYAHRNIHDKLKEHLENANENSCKIHDICISNNGKYWCVVYGNGSWWASAPETFYEQIRYYFANNEVVQSISINDKGDWAIITDKHMNSSSAEVYKALIYARDSLGKVYSIALSENGYIICTANGAYFNNMPTKAYEYLIQRAKQTKVKIVKFTDSGTILVTDGENSYSYYM